MSQLVFLTTEERLKFQHWLLQEIHSDTILLEKLQTIPGMDPLVKQRKIEITAAKVIANKLASITTEEVRR